MDDLKEIKERLLALQETLQGFILHPQLTWSEMLDKFNVVHARLHGLHAQLMNRREKLQAQSITPYQILSFAELIPNVLLRTKPIPEVEEEQAECRKSVEGTLPVHLYDCQNLLEEYNERCKAMLKIVEELQFEHRTNQRYHFDRSDAASDEQEEGGAPQAAPVAIRQKTDWQEYALEQQQILHSLVRFLHVGE